MLYLYAIAESTRVPDLRGLRGAPLKAVGEAGLFAIASEHDELRVEPSEDDLWAHEHVVEDLMDNGSVLPMRFGSALASEDEVLEVLARRRQDFEAALERVRGAVELSVRVAIAAEPDDSENDSKDREEQGPGTAYLLERLHRERHQSKATTRVLETLESLARASTGWSGELRRRQWKAAYLVSHDRIDAFTEQVNLLDAELGDATVLCTGPWPPYSFSAEDHGA